MEEPRIVQEWKAQAYAEGLELGRQEARQEGRREIYRDVLLRLLSLRFSEALPAEILASVRTETNPDRLSEWFDLLVSGTTLEQFRAALTS